MKFNQDQKVEFKKYFELDCKDALKFLLKFDIKYVYFTWTSAFY